MSGIKFRLWNKWENLEDLCKLKARIMGESGGGHIRDAVERAFEGHTKYKHLVRCEAAISNMDETKDLRVYWNGEGGAIVACCHDDPTRITFFNNGVKAFDMDELVEIASILQPEIERLLGYQIDAYAFSQTTMYTDDAV